MSLDYDPRVEYGDRLKARKGTLRRQERLYRLVARYRLLTALLFFVVFWLTAWRGSASPWWLMVPAVAFLVLVIHHVRIAEAQRTATRAVGVYEEGLARIDDRWIGRGQAKETEADESHLYAADLDIFGEGSLFELLCTARTRSGEEALASWLTAPADRDEIQARQLAVEELRQKLDLREDLSVLGSDVRSSVHPDQIVQWGEKELVLRNRWPRVVGVGLSICVLVAVALVWATGTDGAWFLLYGTLVLEGLFALIFRTRVKRVLSAVKPSEEELDLLSRVSDRLEREEFRAPKLRRLQASFEEKDSLSSRQIKRLIRLLDMYEWRRADVPIAIVSLVAFQAEMILLPFLFALWSTQIAFAIEGWRRHCGPSIRAWLSAVGELEALCSLASYAYEHPLDPFPHIVEHGAEFDGEDLGHPLMAAARCVPNTVRLGEAPQMLVVSGSNMSGKSTLLRTVGVNTVLALAGAPVRAARLSVSPLAIGATIRIQDSLQAGTSRFYAEIQRIRYITDLTASDLPVLFLLDEVLHGTNSHDRALGAEAIVRGLIRKGAIGLATTHDLALAKVADSLAPRAENVHFEDQFKDGKMLFDYRMRPGIVRHSNALDLMRAVGLEV